MEIQFPQEIQLICFFVNLAVCYTLCNVAHCQANKSVFFFVNQIFSGNFFFKSLLKGVVWKDNAKGFQNQLILNISTFLQIGSN